MKEQHLNTLLKDLGVEVVHRNSRGWIIAKCPFAPFTHEFGTDRSPSFNVKINPTGYSGYNCWSCKQKGGLLNLVSSLGRLRGHDYKKLGLFVMRKEVPDEFDDWDDIRSSNHIEEMCPLDADLYLRMYGMVWDYPDAKNYLKKRGVTNEAVELLDIRFDPYSKRIVFPVYGPEKALYGFTTRTILPPNDRRPKVLDLAGLRKERCILGEHLIQPGKPLVLVEGLFALAHLYSIGAHEVCTPVASMGSQLSVHQANILADYEETVYILYDLDSAGERGIWGSYNPQTKEYSGGGAYDKLKKHVPVFVGAFPEDVDDVDDFTLDDLKYSMKYSMTEADL